jgi:ribosomal protein L37AE/L43A
MRYRKDLIVVNVSKANPVCPSCLRSSMAVENSETLCFILRCTKCGFEFAIFNARFNPHVVGGCALLIEKVIVKEGRP